VKYRYWWKIKYSKYCLWNWGVSKMLAATHMEWR